MEKSCYYKQSKMKQKDYLELVQRIIQDDHYKNVQFMRPSKEQTKALSFPRFKKYYNSRSKYFISDKDNASVQLQRCNHIFQAKEHPYMFDQTKRRPYLLNRHFENSSISDVVKTKTVRERPVDKQSHKTQTTKTPTSILKNRINNSYSTTNIKPPVFMAYSEKQPYQEVSTLYNSLPQKTIKKQKSVTFNNAFMKLFEEENEKQLSTLSTKLSEIKIYQNNDKFFYPNNLKLEESDVKNKCVNQDNSDSDYINNLKSITYSDNGLLLLQSPKKHDILNKSYLNEDFLY